MFGFHILLLGLWFRDNPEEKLSLSPRKKVTFNSSVTTYEHVSVEESTEFPAENEDERRKREEKEENLAKPTQSQSSSEDGSITSSSGSYPSNHRYQNCRDSDDELDYGESEIEDPLISPCRTQEKSTVTFN